MLWQPFGKDCPNISKNCVSLIRLLTLYIAPRLFPFQLLFCILIGTTGCSQHETGWTDFPSPDGENRTNKKLRRCAGCQQVIKQDEPILTCTFARTGFTLQNKVFHPCGARYHPKCIKAGPPFTTRLRNNAGLAFPKVTHWGTFVCECCTVRAVIKRKLHSRRDWLLLAFERMRLIDMAHAWARKTHAAYQGKLHYIRAFERRFGFTCLTAPPLQYPPTVRIFL